MYGSQGKPKNIWSRLKNRTSLEKVLLALTLLNGVILLFIIMLPVHQEKCSPNTHQIPDIYEETDSFVSTGQGKI